MTLRKHDHSLLNTVLANGTLQPATSLGLPDTHLRNSRMYLRARGLLVKSEELTDR
jgi:hypothetical protein